MASKYHVRSASFPSRSHPSTTAVDEELNKLRSWEASSESTSGSISCGLSGLGDVYRCVDELLKMVSTQQVLSQHHQSHKYLDELLDGSVRILDTCSIARDLVLQTKEQVGALRSAVRRRKGDPSADGKISEYTCFRKKMKKEASRLVASLKLAGSKIEVVDQQHQGDHHLLAVIRVLRDVNEMNISIFQSLFSFLSAPVTKPRKSKWSLVSKLMHKGAVACEVKQEKVNEMESVDIALSRYSSCVKEAEDPEKHKENARKSLEALETSIEEIESGLECVFRRLIKTRTSLLNIMSQ